MQGRKEESDVVAFLLDHFNSREIASRSLVPLSDHNRCVAQVRSLLERGVPLNPEAVVKAATVGNWDVIALYLDHGADVNGLGKTSRGYPYAETPLISASAYGHLIVVRLLLARGADPNIVDSDGRTALVAALSERGWFKRTADGERQLEVIQLLLRNGVRVDVRDRSQKMAQDYVDKWGPSDPYIEEKKALLDEFSK